MNTNFRFQLESPRLTGHRQQKFECPQCGKKKCFVRYVDKENECQYLADDVGKCDHQHSCGYHYTPREYFHDHAWNNPTPIRHKHQYTPPPLPPFQPISMEYVVSSHSPQSTFWQWFVTVVAKKLTLTQERLQQVFNDYFIGATEGNVVFWQIDELHRVHTGHIMRYKTNGHRTRFSNWIHHCMIDKGLLPRDWQLYQCFFGQHLLSLRPDAHVCLVESEKTALVMAAFQPQHVWLATAGSGGLSAERMACLKGRRVTLFPDSGCYDKWKQKMSYTTGIDYNVSDRLESFPENTDLCDLLLNET